MKTVAARVNEEDAKFLVEKYGSVTAGVHALIELYTVVQPVQLKRDDVQPVQPDVPKILHAEKIELGPPMVGLTPADVEKLILKERERTRFYVQRIIDQMNKINGVVAPVLDHGLLTEDK